MITQRGRITAIREILAYEIGESEGTMGPEAEQQLLRELRSLDDAELEEHWAATVAEWLSVEGENPGAEWEKVRLGTPSAFQSPYPIVWNG